MSNLSDRLKTHFGFSSFRPGQEEALQSLISARHTLAVMPTGAGKSLIYQLAALVLRNGTENEAVTLVVSPLIALMKDQVDSLNQRGIPVTFINSSLSTHEQAERMQGISERKYRLVYVAPERLRSTRFLETVQKNPINLMAVDEAHCISEWGHDFRPDYMNIRQVRLALGNPLTVALTATATPRVQADIIHNLGLPEDTARIVTGFNRPNLFLNVRYANGPENKLRALAELTYQPQKGAAIIYTGTRRDAEEVADFMREALQKPAECYHAGLAVEERTRIQDDFIGGRLDVIAATNAFGMGIDRADVRQVIHFSMPGSLENYYQEAGRAGRDGRPARATLIYDPKDRALQEYFIEQSKVTGEILKTIYDSLPKGERFMITNSDISLRTGFHEIQVRVCLSALEQAGVLQHLGDEGLRMSIQKGDWNPQKIDEVAQLNRRHNQNRLTLLGHMLHYAESNECRRRIILDYFGDKDHAPVEDCCDTCRILNLNQTDVTEKVDVSELGYGERAALIVLDCIRRSRVKIGQGKITKILHGSKARDVVIFHYDKNTYYGTLAVIQIKEIDDLINQLVDQGYIKVIGGEYPVLSLTLKGTNALEKKEKIPLNLSKSFDDLTIQRKKEKLEAGGTVEYTEKLFEQGLEPEQIARERGLALTTIYGHFLKLISAERIAMEQVIPPEERLMVEIAILKAGSTENLQLIFEALPKFLDINLIRCVIAGHKQKMDQQPSAPANFTPSQTVQGDGDAVESFLHTAHPRPLGGPWKSGWALGFHSSFSGGEWSRSSVGELTYRLKYQGDTSVMDTLVDQATSLLELHPELGKVDFILPVPSTTQREIQPVNLFSEAFGRRTRLEVKPVVIKSKINRPQKEMTTQAQKLANVKGVFKVNGDVRNKRILVN